MNAYELGTWYGVDQGCGASFDQAGLDAFFSALPTGSVVRVWAMQGAVGAVPGSGIRTWAPLDRLVDTADQYGDYLILVLGDQGGVCDNGHWQDSAWYSGGYRQVYNDDGRGLNTVSYLTWVEEVVMRFRNAPSVAMWEPMNEPEASSCPAGLLGAECSGHQTCSDEAVAEQALRSFFDVIGGVIHQLDPEGLVESGLIGSGQCGAEGQDAVSVEASPGVDVLSLHDYGSPTTALPGSGGNGEPARLSEAASLDKPIIVGEMGLLADAGSISAGLNPGCPTTSGRLGEAITKINGDLAAGVSGVLLWDWEPTPTTAGCTYDIVPGDPYLSWLSSNGADLAEERSVAVERGLRI